MKARIFATEALSGQALLRSLSVISRLACRFGRAIDRMQRKLTDQTPAQALAHARIKAELEDRLARCLFDRGGPR